MPTGLARFARRRSLVDHESLCLLSAALLLLQVIYFCFCCGFLFFFFGRSLKCSSFSFVLCEDELQIKSPFLTVLGQTAPGKGIVFAVDGSEKVLMLHALFEIMPKLLLLLLSKQ
jgi:hypothetical protein